MIAYVKLHLQLRALQAPRWEAAVIASPSGKRLL